MPLSRHIFKAPTRFYKTGVVFLAYLNGHQGHFIMVGGQQSARSLLHLAELFRLADAAGLLADPELAACARMRAVLRVHGIESCMRRARRSRRLMRDLTRDTRLLSINTATLRAQWDAPGDRRHRARPASAGSRPGATRWPMGVAGPRRRSAPGLTVTGLCRGGMFPASTGRPRAAIDDNRRAVDEAAAIGARCLVLVVGGLAPDSRGPHRCARHGARRHRALLHHARAAGMPLAIEPLHPMYAADRACVNTLAQANDLCDELGRGLGVAVDVYHVWWDPALDARDRARRRRRPPPRLSHLRLAGADAGTCSTIAA